METHAHTYKYCTSTLTQTPGPEYNVFGGWRRTSTSSLTGSCSGPQEELTTQIQELTEEASRLQDDQQEALREARERARAAGRRRPRPRSDITHCRRLSLDLQQHLRAGVEALQRRYEPRLLALLRRRQWGEEALRRQREDALDLRARVGPLREQARALELQRACAEERVALLQREREENVAQYRVRRTGGGGGALGRGRVG